MTDNAEVLIKKDSPGKPAGKGLARFENILVMSDGVEDFEKEFNSAKRIGLGIVFVVFGVFGLWAVTMPIQSAAHAPGQVTVKSFRKPVQHLEGGIIKEVRVHEGDNVEAGQVLIVMDDTQAKSQLAALTTQLKSRLAQEARLIAERDNLPAVKYSPELHLDDQEAMGEINAQNQIFKTRKTTLTGEIAVLQQQYEQLQTRVGGLESMRESKSKLAASFQEELKDFQSLLAQGFADKNRLRELDRNFAATTGEVADLTSNIASTKMQAIQTNLQIMQLRNKEQTEVAGQLSDSQTQAKDLRDRITALADTVQRAEVRAPDKGVIYNLKVHTTGTVIPSGTILAEIVPQSDELLIDAKVSPMDIDVVAVGQDANITLTAFNSRTVPKLQGKVVTISADSIPEQNGSTYYMARLELSPDSIKQLHGLPLVPGMPAEVFITTGSRTFFQLLFKPLTDGMSRSFRED